MATSRSPMSAPSGQLTLFGQLPKTSQGGSAPETTPLGVFWPRWLAQMPHSSRHGDAGRTRVWLMDPSEQQLGESSMLNISGWLSGDAASLCSLAEVLETGDVPQRYFLSATACRGILRRAAKRGKQLPALLLAALQAAAGIEPTPTPPRT